MLLKKFWGHVDDLFAFSYMGETTDFGTVCPFRNVFDILDQKITTEPI